MAEYIFKKLIAERGFGDKFTVGSAGTCDEDLNQGVYPPAKKVLEKYEVPCEGHISKLLKKSDYDKYDMIIVMDNSNYRTVKAFTGGDPLGKISMLTDYSGESEPIADPWFTRDFEKCYKSVLHGCEGLLEYLNGENKNG